MALGVLFALSFCPVSAAIFFGTLIPLALPSVYGIGTALPVFAFAILIATGARGGPGVSAGDAVGSMGETSDGGGFPRNLGLLHS